MQAAKVKGKNIGERLSAQRVDHLNKQIKPPLKAQ
jgi:hypothetical protein